MLKLELGCWQLKMRVRNNHEAWRAQKNHWPIPADRTNNFPREMILQRKLYRAKRKIFLAFGSVTVGDICRISDAMPDTSIYTQSLSRLPWDKIIFMGWHCMFLKPASPVMLLIKRGVRDRSLTVPLSPDGSLMACCSGQCLAPRLDQMGIKLWILVWHS